MNIILAAVIVAIIMIFFFASDHFRLRANELWGHYIINILKHGWPYLLIFLIYHLLSARSGAEMISDFSSLNHLTPAVAILIFALYFILIGATANESSERYISGLIKYGWPYLAILAVYELVSNGALQNLVHGPAH